MTQKNSTPQNVTKRTQTDNTPPKYYPTRKPWQSSTRANRLPNDWKKRRKKVLARDRHICQISGPNCTIIGTEVDHIAPGDNHNLNNLQTVCKNCHQEKTIKERTPPKKQRQTTKHPGITAKTHNPTAPTANGTPQYR